MTHTNSGVFFLIVGNSGSGKDTLIRWVAERWPADLPPLLIPRRYITRPTSLETEDFISVSSDEFEKMVEAGAFSLQWVSYDHYFGLTKEIEDHLAQGYPVMANVSRDIILEARQKFPNLKIIFLSVPFEILQQRIISRGREDDAEIKLRLERARENQDFPSADFELENAGEIEEGGQKLLEILTSVVMEQV